MDRIHPARRPQPSAESPSSLPVVAPHVRLYQRRAALLLLFSLIAACLLPGARGLAASPTDTNAAGAIAYVAADTLDEIRLVEPDGSNDRRLWAHGQADPHNVYAIWSMAWRPNAAEIAFTSTHENYCSIDWSDVFAIGVDGGNYRRITQSPSCAGLSAYPKGTVRVPVSNDNIFGESFTGFVYFQGAPSVLPVSLPPGGSTVLTFNNVADFGDEFLQVGAIVHPGGREISFATAVDVRAGETVTTGEMTLFVPTIYWEARSPTWRSDGSLIGYALNFASLFALPPNPSPLDLGQELQTDQSAMPGYVDSLKWGPPAKANQLLYRGINAFEGQYVYLTQEYSATAGQPLVQVDVWEDIRGIAWLPDGSGFIYSVEDDEDTFTPVKANIFEYNFATGQSKPLTNFSNQFAGEVTISSDGTQIVFDLSAEEDLAAPADLYIMNRNGSGLKLLIANGRSPAWSPGALLVPQKIYLPVALRAP